MTSRVLGWGPAALWAAVLFLLSELEGSDAVLPAGADKLVHVGLYSILGLLLAWGWSRAGHVGSTVFLLIVGAGYGALDEWHQSFVPGRDASLGDWMADVVGVVIGLMVFSRYRASSRRGPSLNAATTTTTAATTTATTTTRLSD